MSNAGGGYYAVLCIETWRGDRRLCTTHRYLPHWWRRP